MADIQKHIQKSWLKMNGKLFKLDFEQFGGVLILVKGSGANKRFVAFKLDRYDKENSDKAKSFPIKSRIKIRFIARSTEYKGRWYTDLIIRDISEWKVGEKKSFQQAKMQELFDDSQYSQSFNRRPNSPDNSD